MGPRPVLAHDLDIVHPHDHGHPLHHLAEHHMVTVQEIPATCGGISMGLYEGTVCLMLVSPLGLGVARENEEERFVCVLSRVGHGHESNTGVLQLI